MGGMSLRSTLAPENLLALVHQIRDHRPWPPAAPSTRRAKALAKTLEIQAPDRVVAFLAKVVQLDLSKLQAAQGGDAADIGSGLQRRLEWLERILGPEAAENLRAAPSYKYAAAESARDKALEAMTIERNVAGKRAYADDEVLELELGCLVAYFQLTPPKRQMEGPSELIRSLPMVAIALSTVAPIRRLGEAPGELVTMRDLQPLLFARDEAGAAVAHLEGLGIRRGDLHRAITVLKEARMSFGGGRR
jgi:hypothetical protein